jgi:hypothetical protein
LSRKGRRAERVLRNLFESVSKGDTREIPAKKLTVRSSINVPAGTTFSLDEGLLREFLDHGEIAKKEIDQEIGWITINGKTQYFSFLDLEVTLAGTTKEWRNTLAKDPNQARFELVMGMYYERFPYEDVQGDLQKPSKSEVGEL